LTATVNSDSFCYMVDFAVPDEGSLPPSHGGGPPQSVL